MGDVIPVIDFRRKLGFPDVQYTAHSCLMVVSDEGMTAAVRVDGVVTSIDCTDENFLPVPEGDSVISGYITAENGDRISLVNVKKLLEDR
jgi:chemotaxis signal transduction protein